jgi:hypothetical protein
MTVILGNMLKHRDRKILTHVTHAGKRRSRRGRETSGRCTQNSKPPRAGKGMRT